MWKAEQVSRLVPQKVSPQSSPPGALRESFFVVPRADLILGTSSGVGYLYGRLGDVHGTTASGPIHLRAAARDLDLRAFSGRTDVERCDRLRVLAG